MEGSIFDLHKNKKPEQPLPQPQLMWKVGLKIFWKDDFTSTEKWEKAINNFMDIHQTGDKPVEYTIRENYIVITYGTKTIDAPRRV